MRLIHLVVDDFNDLRAFNLACNIVKLLSERKEMTMEEISQQLQVDLDDLDDIVNKLIKKGLIKSVAGDLSIQITHGLNENMLHTDAF